MDCVWGKWKSSECSKEGERELTREVEIPETLFGEKCQGPDHKTEKCEMPKGRYEARLVIQYFIICFQSVSGVLGLHLHTALVAITSVR